MTIYLYIRNQEPRKHPSHSFERIRTKFGQYFLEDDVEARAYRLLGAFRFILNLIFVFSDPENPPSSQFEALSCIIYTYFAYNWIYIYINRRFFQFSGKTAGEIECRYMWKLWGKILSTTFAFKIFL